MFKIVLQPEERAVLLIVQQGLYPQGREPDAMLLRLIALRMVESDEHGNPKVTLLGEAALARMDGALH
jgi:hypothetical protein